VQPLLYWRSNKYYIFWMCVCSLGYPAFNAHAPYYIVRLYNVFAHCLLQDAIFGGKKFDINVLGIFSTNILWTFLILRRTLRDVIKNVSKNKTKGIKWNKTKTDTEKWSYCGGVSVSVFVACCFDSCFLFLFLFLLIRPVCRDLYTKLLCGCICICFCCVLFWFLFFVFVFANKARM